MKDLYVMQELIAKKLKQNNTVTYVWTGITNTATHTPVMLECQVMVQA